MKKFLLAGVATTALLGGSASAADLALKARPLPPVPLFTWTGFYVGGHGGCAYDRKNYTPGPFFSDDLGPFVLDTANGGGCYGGVQIGYNYQVASWVWGIEADASWGEIKSSTDLRQIEPSHIDTLAGFDQRLRSFGTVRGRLGYTWNWGVTPTLWYVTAGWAWARNELTSTAFDGIPNTLTNSQTHSGWTAGTGLELALGGNWSFKGEYLFMNLGSKTYATAFITDDGDLPGTNVANVDLKIHTVRVGVNYRFGYLPGVMAAY
jgi:outer membrane immunogenic protein